jgi:hypothetical protein
MSDDLNAQIAQRLFGWRYDPTPDLWLDSTHRWVPAWDVPLYSTDPAATARVWAWLERHGLEDLSFHYDRPGEVGCQLSYASQATDYNFVYTAGATWPEALCRAALALAEALAKEGTR